MSLSNRDLLRHYLPQRLLQMLPSLLGVVILVFLMMALIPGDAARIMLGTRVSEEALQRLRSELGLDRPMYVQLLVYLRNLLRLDFGRSISSHRLVLEDIRAFFPATLELSVMAMIFATALGILLGVTAALRRNRWPDYCTSVFSLVGVSMPIYWLGLLVIMLFSVKLSLFPTGGRINPRLFFEPITNFYLLDGLIVFLRTGDGRVLGSALHYLLLPAMTLGMLPLAVIARITRASMLEVLGQDYIQTGRAMGYSRWLIIYKYALKNAMLPILTVIGNQFGVLLSGAILTESIFAWPGLGRWIYHSISARDFPAIQGGILVIALAFLLINLVVDLLYVAVNPKLRLS